MDTHLLQAMDDRLEFYLRQHQRTLQEDMIEINHQEADDELNPSREVISRFLKTSTTCR